MSATVRLEGPPLPSFHKLGAQNLRKGAGGRPLQWKEQGLGTPPTLGAAAVLLTN